MLLTWPPVLWLAPALSDASGLTSVKVTVAALAGSGRCTNATYVVVVSRKTATASAMRLRGTGVGVLTALGEYEARTPDPMLAPRNMSRGHLPSPPEKVTILHCPVA